MSQPGTTWVMSGWGVAESPVSTTAITMLGSPVVYCQRSDVRVRLGPHSIGPKRVVRLRAGPTGSSGSQQEKDEQNQAEAPHECEL